MTFRWIAFSLGARAIASLGGLALALIAAPEDFGVYSRVVLAVLFAGSLVFIRMERAVIGADDLRLAAASTAAGLRVSVITLPVCLGLIWFAVPELARNPGWSTAVALALSLVAKALLLLAFAWLQRNALGLWLAGSVIVQAVTQLSSQTALLATSLPPVDAMLAGDAVGAFAGLAFAIRALQSGSFHCDGKVWRASLQANWRLPLLNLPATLASQAVTMLPLFAVAAHARPVETGVVALAQRIFEPGFHLGATLVTQWAVERRMFRPDVLTRRQRATHVGAYFAFTLAIALCLLVIGTVAQAFPLPPKVSASLAYMLPVIALSAAIGAGGPVMDLAQLAGHEFLILAVNVGALVTGLLILWSGGEAAVILWMFAGLLATRAVLVSALWITWR